MRKLLLLLCGLLLVWGISGVPPAQADDPLGHQINDLGQAVWRAGNSGVEWEIYMYTGLGTPKQLTANDMGDLTPQINNRGHVLWQREDGSDDQIWLYRKRLFFSDIRFLGSF